MNDVAANARRAACLLMLVLAGCSAGQGYEFLQNVGEARAACEREPTVAAQRACEEAYAQDFESYRQERRAVVDGDPGAPPSGD